MCLVDSSGMVGCVDGPSFGGSFGVSEVDEGEKVFVRGVDSVDEL